MLIVVKAWNMGLCQALYWDGTLVAVRNEGIDTDLLETLGHEVTVRQEDAVIKYTERLEDLCICTR